MEIEIEVTPLVVVINGEQPKKTIKLDVDKKDLINMVKGTSPYYSVFENELVKKCGSYTGGFSDKWSWNEHELEYLNEEQLLELYKICVNSWK